MDTLFFIASKIIRIFIDPGNVVFVLFVIGTTAVFARKYTAAKLLLATGCVVSLVLMLLPAGAVLMTRLENRFPVPDSLPDKVDGIIVLGGAVDPGLTANRGQISVNGSAERLLAFVQLSQQYPDARTVYTGGSGSLTDQTNREASMVAPILDSLGMDTRKTVFESDSRNTYENAVLSLALVEPGPDETWILVTSAAHMPRAVGVFRATDWPNIIPYPVDFRRFHDESVKPLSSITDGYRSFGGALAEYLGLLAYYLSGKSDAFFPAPS